MFGFENLKGKKGGSKTFSVADDIHIISKKRNMNGENLMRIGDLGYMTFQRNLEMKKSLEISS